MCICEQIFAAENGLSVGVDQDGEEGSVNVRRDPEFSVLVVRNRRVPVDQYMYGIHVRSVWHPCGICGSDPFGIILIVGHQLATTARPRRSIGMPTDGLNMVSQFHRLKRNRQSGESKAGAK